MFVMRKMFGPLLDYCNRRIRFNAIILNLKLFLDVLPNLLLPVVPLYGGNGTCVHPENDNRF